MAKMRRFIPTAFVATLALTLAAQEFEVATVKPHDPSDPMTRFRNTPGMMEITGMTLKALIQQAYDVRDYQVSGGPGWISSDRFDVAARIETDPATATQKETPFQQNQLNQKRLQALLADRFQLKVRRENKDSSVYLLTVAKGGSKLKESDYLQPFQPTLPPGAPAPPPPPPGGPAAGQRGPRMFMGRGILQGQGVTMDMLIRQLANQVGRPVIDQTGLKGEYDLNLTWTPDGGGMPNGPGGAPLGPVGGEAIPSAPLNGPSLTTAILDLGLKLDSGRAPVETIVIESVQKPSAN